MELWNQPDHPPLILLAGIYNPEALPNLRDRILRGDIAAMVILRPDYNEKTLRKKLGMRMPRNFDEAFTLSDGMTTKTPGVGQTYMGIRKDKDGQYLQGDRPKPTLIGAGNFRTSFASSDLFAALRSRCKFRCRRALLRSIDVSNSEVYYVQTSGNDGRCAGRLRPVRLAGRLRSPHPTLRSGVWRWSVHQRHAKGNASGRL